MGAVEQILPRQPDSPGNVLLADGLDYLCNSQAARYLNVNREHLIKSKKTGLLLGISAPKKINRRLYKTGKDYSKTELDDWLQKAKEAGVLRL